MSGISCPHCALAARSVNVGPLQLDLCERCGAIWFDHGEVEATRDAGGSEGGLNFRQAVRELLARKQTVELRPYIACPVCSTSLRRRVHPEFAGVAAYVCSQHGAWLERRHLLRLMDEIDEHGAPEARRRAERRAAQEEAKRTQEARARAEEYARLAYEVDSPSFDWLVFW